MPVDNRDPEVQRFYREELKQQFVRGFYGSVTVSCEQGLIVRLKSEHTIKMEPSPELAPDREAKNARCLERALGRITPDFFGRIILYAQNGSIGVYEVQRTYKDCW